MTVSAPYGQAYKNLGLGLFDFSAHTFKLALADDSYIPDTDADEFFADVTGEVAGAGYTAGGETLTGLTWLYDATNNWCVLSCDGVNWAALTPPSRFAIVYRDTGDPDTSPLLSYVDFQTELDPEGGPLPITFPAGVFRLTTPTGGPSGTTRPEED